MKKWQAFIKDDRGVIAPFFAIFLTAFVAFLGAAVDLGMIYSARGQLQTAVDAAAMGAARDLLVQSGGSVDANYDGAEATAVSLIEANTLLGQNLTWGDADTYEAGFWDLDADAFVSTGYTDDPAALNAVRVVLKRTIETYFIKLVGINNIDLSASATGFLGCAGDGTKPELPIVVDVDALANPGDTLVFNNENDENVQWTSFFTWPCNMNTVSDYMDDPDSIPNLNIGDEIYMNNGVIVPLLRTLADLFDENQSGGEWRVILPVGQWSPPQNRGNIVGFVQFAITEVDDHGSDKGLTGYWPDDGQLIAPPGASVSSNCFGVRASSAVLLK